MNRLLDFKGAARLVLPPAFGAAALLAIWSGLAASGLVRPRLPSGRR
jgi:hypothetical protein